MELKEGKENSSSTDSKKKLRSNFLYITDDQDERSSAMESEEFPFRESLGILFLKKKSTISRAMKKKNLSMMKFIVKTEQRV